MELLDRTPADSPLVGVAFGVKLLVVAAAGILISIFESPWVLLGLMAATGLLYVIGRVPLSAWWRTMRGIFIFLIFIVVFQAWSGDVERGLRTAVQMLAMVSLAALITATTPFEKILDAVQRWLAPFRRFGVSPETVALAVGMTIRFIPLLTEAAAEIADSFKARGLRPWPWRLMFPLVRRSLLLAGEVGAVLVAREPVSA